jgi:hypothetical protein
VDLHDGRATHKVELMLWDQGQNRLCIIIKKILDIGIKINLDTSLNFNFSFEIRFPLNR